MEKGVKKALAEVVAVLKILKEWMILSNTPGIREEVLQVIEGDYEEKMEYLEYMVK